MGPDDGWDGRGHFFAAAALNMAPRTVKRDWTFARAWLFEALGGRE